MRIKGFPDWKASQDCGAVILFDFVAQETCDLVMKTTEIEWLADCWDALGKIDGASMSVTLDRLKEA